MNYRLKAQNTISNSYAHQVRNYIFSASVQPYTTLVRTQFGTGNTAQSMIERFCKEQNINLTLDPKDGQTGCYGWYSNGKIWLEVRENDHEGMILTFFHELGHLYHEHKAYRNYKDFVKKELQADAFMYRCALAFPLLLDDAKTKIENRTLSRATYDALRKVNRKNAAKKKRKINLAYAQKLSQWAADAKRKVDALKARFDKNANATVGKWLQNAIQKASKAADRFTTYMKPYTPH
jgi:hypothetical protein